MKTIYIKLICIVIGLFLCISCSNQKLAVKKLRSSGYTNIKYYNYKQCCCSCKDIYATGFTAVKNNKVDSGVIYRKHRSTPTFIIIVD